MRFLKENDELKIYKIIYGIGFGDDADEIDVEFDWDFPGYTVVYAHNEGEAVELFENEFRTYEILHISEIDKELEKRVRASIDFVDFYK